MAAEVDICNQAILAVGGDQILSLDATSKEGKLCNALYPKLRDKELTKHSWNFAITRKQIASITETPVYGYEHKLQLPSELLRLLDVESAIEPPTVGHIGTLDFGAWKVEGRTILANEAPLNIRYIQRVTDATLFPEFFVETLAARLAAELAIPFRNDKDLADRLKNKYEALTATARFNDATEDAVTRLDADDWLLSRGDFNLSQVPRKIVP